MAEGSDLIVATAMIDEIRLADGRTISGVLGGAGIHALAGAALWADDPVLVTGVGEDCKTVFGAWFRRNGLSTRGLVPHGGLTPLNIVTYESEDRRSERQAFGPARFAAMRPQPADIAKVSPGSRSAYVFARTDDGLLDCVAALRRDTAVLVLWEIALDTATAGNLPNIAQAARETDALSINREEAGRIFQTLDEKELTERLRQLGAPVVFLRLGQRGSLVIEARRTWRVPSLSAEAVDPTGAGNAYSGAALAALAGGAEPAEAAAKATVAALMSVAQHGTYEPRSPTSMSRARSLLCQIHTEIV